MPDSNLGDAVGRVIITSDTAGADKAGASMAALNAEAKGLQSSMADSGDSMDRNEKQARGVAAAYDNLRSKQEGLRQRQQEATDANKKYMESQRELNRVLLDTESTNDKLAQARKNAEKDEREAVAAKKNAVDAEKAFQHELAITNESYSRRSRAVREFVKANQDTVRSNEETARSFRSLRSEIDGLNRTLGTFTHIDSTAQSFKRLTDSIDAVRSASLLALGGGSLLGGGGLLAGGGAEGITAMVASMSELVGVVGLLPGVIGAAGASLGVFAVGLHGVQESIAAMGDTKAFVASLKDVSPVMRTVLTQIESFYSSFRGAMNVVQDSLVAPLVSSIQPLIYTYLPLLMNQGSELASVFGQAGKLFADWLETPSTIKEIQTFLQNVTAGFQSALPAVQAFSSAFLTISNVGSGFFKELGTSLAQVAQEFNNFINGATASGSLQAFIKGGIDAFGVLFNNIKNVSEALFNIFTIGNQYGGGFLAMFKDIGQEFLNWTQSANGIKDIRDFFQEITAAGHALHPILSVIGSSIATLVSSFVQLGVATAPGLMSFFTSLEQTLQILSPVLINSAPAFNIFLTALGQLIEQVAGALGPNLPAFLTAFATAATQLIGPATTLATVIGNIFAHLTPADITAIIAVVSGFEQLGKVLPVVTGALALFQAAFSPVGLAVGILAAGLVLLVEHFGGIGPAIDAAIDEFHKLPEQISSVFNTLINGAADWGVKLIDNFMQGIIDQSGPLSGVIKEYVADPVDRMLHPGSPTKAGPFSEDGGTGGWGAALMSNFAEGIASGATPTQNAAQSVAAAGAGGLTYTGAADPAGRGGQAGSAGGSQGTGLGPYGSGAGDGFLNWINSITKELSGLSKIFHEATNIFTQSAQIGLKSIDTFARLWQGGVNPLTAPGGFDQGATPLIPQVALPGTANVPGVPQATPSGAYAGPDASVGAAASTPQVTRPPGFIGPIAPGATGPNAKTSSATAPGPGSPTSQIISYGRSIGLNDDQLRAALAIGSDESHLTDLGTNFSGGNASVGGVRGVYQQSPGWHPNGAAHDIQTFLDTFKKNLDAQPGADPLNVAVGIQQHGAPGAVTPYQGTPGDVWYRGQVQNAIRNNPDYGAAISQLGGGIGQRDVSTSTGGSSGIFRPGVIQGEQGLQPATRNVAGIIQRLFPQIQTIGGVHPDSLPYHPSGHALDIMLPGDFNSPQDIALGNQINQFLRDNAQALGIGDTIYRSRYYATGQQPTAYQYSGNDQDQLHNTHIHTTLNGPGGLGGPEPTNFQTDISKLILPPGLTLPGNPPASTTGEVASNGGLSSLLGDNNFYRQNYPNAFAPRPPLNLGGLGQIAGAGLAGAGVIGLIRQGFRLRSANNDVALWQGLLDQQRGTGDFAPSGDGASIGALNVSIPRGISGTGDPLAGISPIRPSPTQVFNNIARLPQGPGITSIADLPPLSPIDQLAAQGPGEWAQGRFARFDAARSAAITPTGEPLGSGGGIRGALGIAGRVLGPALTVAGALPWAWGASGNIAGNNVVNQAGPRGIDQILSGQRAYNAGTGTTTTINDPTGGLLGGPYLDGGGVASNRGQTGLSPAQVLAGIPDSTRRLAAQNGAPIPAAGSTPVHVTNTDQMPGGPQSKSPFAGANATGGVAGNIGRVFQGSTGGTAALTGSPSPVNNQPLPQQGPISAQPPAGGGLQSLPPGTSAGGGPLNFATSLGVGGQQGVPGVPEGNAPISAESGYQIAQTVVGGATNITNSVFQSIDSIIQSVGAFGNLVDTVAKVPKNSEQVIGMIKDVQQFITTGAQIASTVSTVLSSVGSFVGAGASADPSGATAGVAAAFGAASTIASLVGEGLSVLNAGISLGIDVYHETTKVAANVFGFTLGGANTGWLGGNVQMLLNTNNGQLYTYGSDNPLSRNVLTPGFQNAYQHTNADQTPTIHNVSVYAGPGETTQTALANTVWAVNTAPEVISAAGRK